MPSTSGPSTTTSPDHEPEFTPGRSSNEDWIIDAIADAVEPDGTRKCTRRGSAFMSAREAQYDDVGSGLEAQNAAMSAKPPRQARQFQLSAYAGLLATRFRNV